MPDEGRFNNGQGQLWPYTGDFDNTFGDFNRCDAVDNTYESVFKCQCNN